MWKAYPFGLDEVVCQKTALSFVDSVWEVFGGLLRGIKTVVLPDESVRDPRKLVHALRASRVSRIVLVPSLLRQLVADGIDLREELPQLKYWTASGEALSRDLCTDFRQSIPHAILLNLYGSSEVAADSVYCDLSERELPARSVPIGRPIANTHVYVLDRHLNPVPIGVPGELFVGGFGLARGYHNQPALTAERFIANPFPDAASPRLYKTGDLVRYRSDGQLEFLSRLDHQVKIRGHRIELGEIETVLTEHPQVGEAVVMMAQGGDDARLVAYVAPRRQGHQNGPSRGKLEPTENHALISGLRPHLRARLPEYMVPVDFVILDQLPQTANGKIDRRQLPIPKSVSREFDRAYVAPRTSVEEALAAIWSEVLDVERVGADDNFFDLGGHSLLATQLVSRVRDRFKVEVPLQMLFRAPSLAEFATSLLQRAANRSAVERIAQIITSLAHLSDAEVKQMLEQRAGAVEGGAGS